ncbi:MAG: DUF3267 domain-containing protein [Clostridia bacterium]|nr:DUF3267 domain-containing protein [Clostridia bacterium]
MKSTQLLPEGYGLLYSVDLQKNKKTALIVNVVAALIAVAMMVPAHFVIPITTLFTYDEMYIPRLLSVVVLYVGYIVLHELVHGVAMKICGTKKVKYGFTGMYAFAGSDDYYSKGSYIFIALAPVVLWGVVLGVLSFIVPTSWFWVLYMVQVGNISGAAGDFFVTFKFSRMPRDILVKDYGVGMNVYSEAATKQ